MIGCCSNINFLHLTSKTWSVTNTCSILLHCLGTLLEYMQYSMHCHGCNQQSIMLARYSMWVIPTYCCIIMILCRVESINKTSLTSGPCHVFFCVCDVLEGLLKGWLPQSTLTCPPSIPLLHSLIPRHLGEYTKCSDCTQCWLNVEFMQAKFQGIVNI